MTEIFRTQVRSIEERLLTEITPCSKILFAGPFLGGHLRMVGIGTISTHRIGCSGDCLRTHSHKRTRSLHYFKEGSFYYDDTTATSFRTCLTWSRIRTT